MKTLVTDGRSLASLAIIRSLGRNGHTIHCGESFKQNLSSYSKYVDKRIIYPDPSESPDEFANSLLSNCNRESYDLVIPVRDETTTIVSKHRDQLSKISNVCIDSHKNISKLMDKGETIKIAKQAGIPTPKTWFPENESTEYIRNQVNYPILIRPRRSSGSRGIKFVNSQSEFDEKYNEVLKQYGTPIVQEYIEKSGYTTACLLFSRDNQVVGEFSYERVKEYPLSGGPTVVGISTNDEEAKYYAKTLLGQLDWAGPAEVEFILDQNGTPKLLEVNPRFWMPLQLAISAGVDFPNLLSELAVGNNPNHIHDYELDLTYRWILPNEILWMANSLPTLGAMYDLFRFDRETECYASLSKKDPKPVLGTVIQSLRFITDPNKRKLMFERGWSS